MTTNTYTITDYLAAFLRRRSIFLGISLPIVILAGLYSLLAPSIYHSSSSFSIDLEGVGAQALEPIDITVYADKYIRSIHDRVMTRENISNWILELEIFSREDFEEDESAAISAMRENLSLEMITQPVLESRSGKLIDVITGFRVGFSSKEPELAYAVATKLAAEFLLEDRSFRTERASSTSSFLKGQIDMTESETVILEQKLADFKMVNACCLPELVELNSTVIERTDRDLETIESQIQVLERDRIFQSSQLQEVQQTSYSAKRRAELELELGRLLATYEPDHPDLINVRKQLDALNAAAPGSGASTELLELRAELAAKQLKYSDAHPDIIGLKRRIAALENEQSQRGGRSRDGAEADPRYLQLRASVNAIDTELSSLRARSVDLRTKIEEYEQRLARTPQIESEYLALNRQLETARMRFRDLQDRQTLARQTEALESNEIGARLKETESAYLSDSPNWPPRAVITIIGALFALVAGTGGALVSELMDTTIRGSKDIISVMQAVPIAAIPVVQNSLSQSAVRNRRLILIGSFGLILIIAVVFTLSRAPV